MSGAPRRAKDMVAMHLCDNGLCSSPMHIYWGGRRQNMRVTAADYRLVQSWAGATGRSTELGWPFGIEWQGVISP